MKRIFLSTAAALALVTAVQAQVAPAPATPGQVTAGQVTPESVVSDLKAQGFTSVEVTVGPTQIKAEAIKDGMRREVIIDRATGSILKSEETSGTVSTVSGAEIRYQDRDFLNGNSEGDKANSDDERSDESADNNSDDSGDRDGKGDGDSRGDGDNGDRSGGDRSGGDSGGSDGDGGSGSGGSDD